MGKGGREGKTKRGRRFKLYYNNKFKHNDLHYNLLRFCSMCIHIILQKQKKKSFSKAIYTSYAVSSRIFLLLQYLIWGAGHRMRD